MIDGISPFSVFETASMKKRDRFGIGAHGVSQPNHAQSGDIHLIYIQTEEEWDAVF